MIAVRPEFRPSLNELLSGRRKVWRYGLIGFYVLVIVVALWILLLRPEPGSHHFVSRDNPAFNLGYDKAYHRVATQPGERLRLKGTGGRLVVITPLHLPAYSGAADGFLPAFSEHLNDQMAGEFPGYQRRRDGRPSIRRIPGYEIVFQYTRDGKTAYGRRLLLLDSYRNGARDGVDMLVLEDRSSVVPFAEAVGTTGPLKTLLSSFAFGT